MRKLIVIFVLVIGLLLLSKVSALGITPGRTTIDYVPGKEISIPFSVVNTEKRDMQIVVYVRGDLNDSVSLSEVAFSMPSTQYEKQLKYTVTMPERMSPGPSTTEIVVMQLPQKSSKGDTFIGATVAVATQLSFFVPYPDKYLEADVNIASEADGKIVFVIPVVNRGKLGLARVRANIDIYGKLNEKVAKFDTNELSLEPSDKKELTYKWEANVTSGVYRAVITVLYDEEAMKIDRQFEVGKPLLDLERIEVNDFTLGEIAKFEMLVENKWSEVLKGVYAQMQIFDKQKEVMADIKSPTYDIPVLSKKTLVAYWDTKGVSKGVYDSSVFLRYGEHSTQKDFKLDVKEDSITAIGLGYVISSRSKSSEKSSLTFILIVAIVVLILINLLWFMYFRKKFVQKKT